MATGGKLSVEIGADITDFEKKIKEVEYDIKELSKVKLEKIRLGLDTKEINAQIKDAKANLNGLKSAVKDTGGQIGGQFTKQVGNGSATLMQFSRIAQDAPFGIMGIGNNITATAESFGYLKQQTGSTSGALKAMASSIMGTGGILLGVSLLTTGLTLLAQSGLSVGDVIDKITGNFDEFGNSIKKAREEGIQSAGKEVESLRSLVTIAQNDNIAKKDRFIAVEKLQSQFPAYYGNLSKEQIMYGDLTKVTHEATKALIAKAVAEKLSEKAGEKFIERMAAQKKFNDAKQKIVEFDKESAKRGISDYKELTRLEFAKLSAQEKVSAQLSATRSEQRKKLVADSEVERQILIDKIRQYEKLTGVIDKLNETAAPLEQTAPKAVKIPTPKKPKVNPNAGNEFTPFLQEFTGAVVPEMALTFKDPTEGFAEWNSKIALGLTTTEASWMNTVNNIGIMMEQALEAGIFNIGDAIGAALVNGDNILQAAGGSLLQTLGAFVSDVAKEMIQFGILTAAFGTAKEAVQKSGLSGATAIAAGIALSVIGSALSASGKRVSSAAGGKGGGTSTATGADANNTSTTSGGGYGWSGGGSNTVVFEIAGTSLIGVLNNTTTRNLRLGGR